MSIHLNLKERILTLQLCSRTCQWLKRPLHHHLHIGPQVPWVPQTNTSKALIDQKITLSLGCQPGQGSQILHHNVSISLSPPLRVGRPCRARWRGRSRRPSPPSSAPHRGRTPCWCPWRGLPRRQLHCNQLQGGRRSPDRRIRLWKYLSP